MSHGWRVAGDPHLFFKLSLEARIDVLALCDADDLDVLDANRAVTPDPGEIPGPIRRMMGKAK